VGGSINHAVIGECAMAKLTMPRGVRWYSADEALQRGLLH